MCDIGRRFIHFIGKTRILFDRTIFCSHTVETSLDQKSLLFLHNETYGFFNGSRKSRTFRPRLTFEPRQNRDLHTMSSHVRRTRATQLPHIRKKHQNLEKLKLAAHYSSPTTSGPIISSPHSNNRLNELEAKNA